MRTLILTLISLIYISCNKNNINDNLIGKWQTTSDTSAYVEFTKSGLYKWYLNGKNISEISNFGSLSYELITNDNLTELIILDKDDNLFVKSMIQLRKDELINVSFKQGKNIDHHVDEYWVSHRKNRPRTNNKSNEIIKFIYPKNYKGASLIIYNEPNGQKPHYDKNGNKIYLMPKNGILKTTSTIDSDPFLLAKGATEFYYKDENSNLEDSNNLIAFSTSKNSSVIAKIFGYNQLARNIINEIINDQTKKNILFLCIDSTEKINNTSVYDSFVETFNYN